MALLQCATRACKDAVPQRVAQQWAVSLGCRSTATGLSARSAV